jgi:PAS domain S-box-containing protein
MIFAVAAHLAVLDYGKTKFTLDFEHKALERFAAVENRIINELAVVNTLVAYVTLQPDIDRADFDRLIEASARKSKVHAYQALEWIPHVPRAQKNQYEVAAKADGFAAYHFKQRLANNKWGPVTADRAAYFPVHYVYPYVGNEGALGFDLGSNPARLKALELARDSNSSVASARIKLVQTSNDPAGVLVFSPVYKNNTDISTVKLRRENLYGFALGVFRISQMVDTALNSSDANNAVRSPAGIDLYLFDGGTDNTQELIFIHHSRSRKNHAPALVYDAARQDVYFSHEFLVGGRVWTLIARPTITRLATTWHAAAATTSIAILGISFLSAVFFTSISRQNQQVRILVDQRTAELKEASQRALISEARVRAVVETVVDGIITFDENGIIESINPAATQIFDYDEANLIGTRMWVLLPQPWCDEYEEYLRIYRQSRDTTIVGGGREIQGLRSNGSEFPLDIGINEMTVAGQRKFTCVVRDITAQKLAEKMKSEFVSTVSHELRTPLTSIKGSLGLIRSGVTGDMPQKLMTMLEIAYKNSERLVLLINDILDIEKIEAGKMDFHMVDLDLGPLVVEAVNANEAYAAEHNVKLDVSIPDGPAFVRGDHARLMQVLANLLSNAAKFSSEGGTVEIWLEQLDDIWRLSVTDHGVGIPDEFVSTIFQRFSQADSSDTRKIGGTGLGLSICRAIIDNYDGEIDFSTAVGKGSTFYFDLPVSSSLVDYKGSIDVDMLNAENNRGVRGARGSKPHVLHIEDDSDVLTILSALSHGIYRFTSAENLAVARKLLQDHTFDLVILDLNLPDGSGEEILPLLNDPGFEPTPVIIFSAQETTQVLAQNVKAVLVKSQTTNEKLLATVRAAISFEVEKTNG